MGIGTEWLRMGLLAKQQREEQARADASRQQFRGLLGNEPIVETQPQAGPMLPGQERPDVTAQVAGTGTGLLGGQMSMPEFYAQTAAIPGYEQMGMRGLMAGMGETQKPTGIMQNLVAAGYQPGTPEYQKAMREYLMKDKTNTQQGFGKFKDYDQFLKAQADLRNRANTQLGPSRESLRKFNQATDILNKRKSFKSMTGADDTVLIKAFASMILPGEAVMEGDIAAIVNQSGLPGTIQSYLQAFKGEGQLGEQQRKEIYNAMTSLAERAQTENTEIRDLFNNDIDFSGFNPKSIFRPRIGFSPFIDTTPQPPGNVKRVIK